MEKKKVKKACRHHWNPKTFICFNCGKYIMDIKKEKAVEKVID